MSEEGERNRRKRERLRRELGALRTEFAAWLELRRGRDAAGQQASQLTALEDCITGAARGLEQHLDTLKLGLPRAEFAEECRQHDLRILWLRRVWRFFRVRFDQRDDPRLASLLRAADEVIWSAWQPVTLRGPLLGLTLPVGPAPLPFIDLEHSPAATPHDLIPGELRQRWGPLLAGYLEQLPIALIHLPASIVASPWWLVFIGHEVGHHLQRRLKLTDGFQAHLEQTVLLEAARLKVADAAGAASRWGYWSQEVFADVYSVVSFGTAAVRAIAEFESLSKARRGVLATLSRYPPPPVRLQVLVRTAELLGLSGARAALDGLELQTLVADMEQEQTDWRLVDTVAAASLADLPGLDVALTELVDFNARQFGLEWPTVPAPFDLSGSRRMASAALAAWERTEQADDASALDALAEAVKQLLGENRLPGRRGEPTPMGSPRVDGDRLSDLLLGLDLAQLEAATGDT